MATFSVTLQSGSGTFKLHPRYAQSAQQAMERAEGEVNRIWVGERQAQRRIADGDGVYTQDGEFLVLAFPVRARSAEIYRTDYVACGAYASGTGEVVTRA